MANTDSSDPFDVSDEEDILIETDPAPVDEAVVDLLLVEPEPALVPIDEAIVEPALVPVDEVIVEPSIKPSIADRACVTGTQAPGELRLHGRRPRPALALLEG